MKKEIKKIKEEELKDVNGGSVPVPTIGLTETDNGNIIKLPAEDKKGNTLVEKIH